jgi:alkaline phosphatase D
MHGRRAFLLDTARIAALASAAPAMAVPQAYPFSLGVASGAPLPDSVILWTRILANPLDAASVQPIALPVRWEVAADEAFRQVVARGSAVAAPELAHSVHVDVRGLAPARWYWYRFMLGSAISPVGRTRTAPAAGSMPGALRLAVASCQHWQFGSYAAHRHIAASSPDLVAFLGDYIYEWGAFQLDHPPRAVRANESFTLEHYRARYAQYKSDADLQAAHRVAPWIVTWDDHEVANDYAGERDERLAADFPTRRAAAYQAFYEHMPLRLPPAQGGRFPGARMYQRYDWGRLARFHVLDDRQYRAVEACTPTGRGGSSSVTPRDCAALRDPRRTMLGAAQENWLEEGLNSARATWNVFAQQTPMAQASQVPVRGPQDGRFWTDGWDGYPAARARLFQALAKSRATNPVILAGDVHTFYASELRASYLTPASNANPILAAEFCGTSVTSNSRPQARTDQIVGINPHIKYGRSDKRGYMLMDFTPTTLSTQMMGLDDVRDAKTNVAALATFRVAAGRSKIERTG